jgi:hypothetical protein
MMELLQVARLTVLDEAMRWRDSARLTEMVAGAAARRLTGDDVGSVSDRPGDRDRGSYTRQPIYKTAPPITANRSEVLGDRVSDRWAHVSAKIRF